MQKVLLAVIVGFLLFPLAAFAGVPAASMAGASIPVSVIHSNGNASRQQIPENIWKAPTVVSAPPLRSASMGDLDAKLAAAQSRLAKAQRDLGQGQQQLQQLTSTMRLAMKEAGSDAVGLHPFVRVASRYAGTPYVWGGESRYGFDCSGFIIRVMRDLGYKALPHSAAEQFNYGTPVSKSMLKPGDLVFFANTYKPGVSHVGIYIGRHRFIHAASTKKGTIVSDLRDALYVKHYAGARRLASVK